MEAFVGLSTLYYLTRADYFRDGHILSWHNGGDLNDKTKQSGNSLYHDTIAGHTIGRPDKEEDFRHKVHEYKAPLIRQHTGGHYGRSWLSETGGRGGNDGFYTNSGMHHDGYYPARR